MPSWFEVSLQTGVSAMRADVTSIAALTVFFAGVLRGFVGFGSSLSIVMVMSAIVGPPAAVGIAGLSGLAPAIQLLPTAMRHSERSFVLPFCLLIFVAAPFGTWLLVLSDPALMKILISLFILAMVWMLYRDWRPDGMDRPGFLMFAGTASGLLQGCAGVGGPPAVAIALSRAGSAQQQRANVIGATIALALRGLPPLWYHGVLTAEVIAVSVVAIPFYTLGTWLGARSFSQHGRQHFRNAALLALAVVGVITLALALRDYHGQSLFGGG